MFVNFLQLTFGEPHFWSDVFAVGTFLEQWVRQVFVLVEDMI